MHYNSIPEIFNSLVGNQSFSISNADEFYGRFFNKLEALLPHYDAPLAQGLWEFFSQNFEEYALAFQDFLVKKMFRAYQDQDLETLENMCHTLNALWGSESFVFYSFYLHIIQQLLAEKKYEDAHEVVASARFFQENPHLFYDFNLGHRRLSRISLLTELLFQLSDLEAVAQVLSWIPEADYFKIFSTSTADTHCAPLVHATVQRLVPIHFCELLVELLTADKRLGLLALVETGRAGFFSFTPDQTVLHKVIREGHAITSLVSLLPESDRLLSLFLMDSQGKTVLSRLMASASYLKQLFDVLLLLNDENLQTALSEPYSEFFSYGDRLRDLLIQCPESVAECHNKERVLSAVGVCLVQNRALRLTQERRYRLFNPANPESSVNGSVPLFRAN